MRLYSKGLLAFAASIIIAVTVVILLVGDRTQSEFRQYTVLYSKRTQNLLSWLVNYYQQAGSWDEVQAELNTHDVGRKGNSQGAGSGQWDYFVTDSKGNVVADSSGDIPAGKFGTTDLRSGLPIEVGEDLVGYFIPDANAQNSDELDAPAAQFLTEVQNALLVGGLVAFVGAMAIAVMLMRSIVAPVRALTSAAEQVAHGDLEIRAPSRGKDELAELGKAFNTMAVSLQRAEESRQAQTADIAHELRNPLSVLQGTLEALADQIYEPTPENLQPALDQVQTLNRLVSDLRTLALADAGQLHLNIAPVDIGKLVARVAGGFHDRLESKGIAMLIDRYPELPPIQGDTDRLTQVLNNLFSNTLRYVPEGCTVNISTYAADKGVMLRFIDNGQGVPEHELPHLFDRFWRAEPSRSRVTGGSGLGLSIAKHIIEAHGGRIWAKPTPGGGLTLNMWFPA